MYFLCLSLIFRYSSWNIIQLNCQCYYKYWAKWTIWNLGTIQLTVRKTLMQVFTGSVISKSVVAKLNWLTATVIWSLNHNETDLQYKLTGLFRCVNLQAQQCDIFRHSAIDFLDTSHKSAVMPLFQDWDPFSGNVHRISTHL